MFYYLVLIFNTNLVSLDFIIQSSLITFLIVVLFMDNLF
jgi:hypothetical protein